MFNKRHVTLPILIGIITSHIFFTYYIHISNHLLYDKITAIINEGYLAVPNAHILPSLHSFLPAFIGAAFFTLTIGITCSFFSFFLAKLWSGPFNRNRSFLKGIILIILLCVVLINRNGINLLFSFWFLGVFWLVFNLTVGWNTSLSPRFSFQSLRVHVSVLILLAVFYTISSKGDIFVVIRDQVLFPSNLGKTVIDLYYRYTLYPAETIKSFNQKLFNTCHLKGFQNNNRHNAITDRLLAANYLPLKNENAAVDVSIWDKGGMLFFTIRGNVVLKKDIDFFLNNVENVLKDLSTQSDRQHFIRRMIAVSLLMGLPLVVYGLLFWLAHAVLSRYFSAGKLPFAAVTICLLLIISLYLLVVFKSPKPVPIKQLPDVLASKDWKMRINGLQTIVDQQLEIMSYTNPSYVSKSPYPLERMWAARTLGYSRSPKTFDLLWTLIDDKHPNVACMALQSVGRRGDTSTILPVIHWIRNSKHWYAQWYAYQTLKMLRWKQHASK